jgi:glycosyltransferase involved in cell wall biosynthesis
MSAQPEPIREPIETGRSLRPVRPPAFDAAAMTVTFLIPAYNEERTIEEVLDRIEDLPLRTQIICIDDGSVDGTLEILKRRAEQASNMVVVSQRNRGKGAAIRRGIPFVTGDIVVIQDADMEYDPAEVPRLVEPIQRGVADVVYGSRLSGGQPQRAYMFWHLVGNKFLTLTTNILFNTTLSDMETGYKAFRAEVLSSLDLHQNSFTIEPEITAKICKKKLRIYEMPISYYGRTYEEGKKITWRDGFKALWVLAGTRIGAL